MGRLFILIGRTSPIRPIRGTTQRVAHSLLGVVGVVGVPRPCFSNE